MPRVTVAASAGPVALADPSGSVTRNVAPCPSPGLSACTAPPWTSTRWRTIDRPRPSPPWVRVTELSACTNLLKRCGKTSGRMPMPVSPTVSCARRSARSRRNGDATAVRRELDGVAEQVAHHLLQAPRITVDGTDAGGDVEGELESLGVRRWPGGVDGLLDGCREVDGPQVEEELSRDDARDVEQVVDEPRLATGGPLDRGARPLDPRVLGRRLLEDVRRHQHRAQRRPQLVRERGEKQVLRAIRALGLEPRLLLGLEEPHAFGLERAEHRDVLDREQEHAARRRPRGWGGRSGRGPRAPCPGSPPRARGRRTPVPSRSMPSRASRTSGRSHRSRPELEEALAADCLLGQREPSRRSRRSPRPRAAPASSTTRAARHGLDDAPGVVSRAARRRRAPA